jgi:hypothetical protein
VRVTQADIEWAKKVLQDGAEKGFHTLDAAFLWFVDCWRKDPERKKRKAPGRSQFLQKIWKRRVGRPD